MNMDGITHVKTIWNKVRVPAWIGSLLFHLFLLVLFFLYIKFQPAPPTAPGRIASGGIVMMDGDEEDSASSESGAGRDDSTSEEEEPLASPTLEEVLAGELSEIHDLKEILPDTPGSHSARTDANPAGASSLAGTLSKGGGARPGAGQGIGGKARVRFFGSEGQGMSFVFVLDRSGSMNEHGGKPIRAAKAELIRSLGSLDTFHKFNIIAYNEKPLFWQPGKMVFANDIQKTSATKFVNGILPMGGTQHRESLTEAIRLRPDVIFFLTDGDRNDDLKSSQLQSITQHNSRLGAGAQINVIQFAYGEKQESRTLWELANKNRGQFIYINILELR